MLKLSKTKRFLVFYTTHTAKNMIPPTACWKNYTAVLIYYSRFKSSVCLLTRFKNRACIRYMFFQVAKDIFPPFCIVSQSVVQNWTAGTFMGRCFGPSGPLHLWHSYHAFRNEHEHLSLRSCQKGKCIMYGNQCQFFMCGGPCAQSHVEGTCSVWTLFRLWKSSLKPTPHSTKLSKTKYSNKLGIRFADS